MQRRTRIAAKAMTALAFMSVASLGLTACGGSSDSGDTGGSSGDKVAVTLITKTNTNPFFIAMQEGAKKAGEEQGVSITTAAGAADGDTDGQVKAIEAAVARGDKGILITPNGPGVNSAIENARNAGLYVIALDTPPDPADTVDPWIAAHLEELATLAEATLPRLVGDTVVHCDLRADNLLVRPDGSMVAVDWPWALVGPAWLDRCLLMINIDLYGGHDVERLVQRYLGDVDPALITGAIAGLCAFFTDAGRQPPASGLPTLRAFQQAQADSTAAWLRRRLDTDQRASSG